VQNVDAATLAKAEKRFAKAKPDQQMAMARQFMYNEKLPHEKEPTMRDLAAMWTGKAIFTDAFLKVLPRRQTTAQEPEPRVATKRVVTTRQTRVRQGATIYYTAGPAQHRRGRNVMNWTNYMVRTILAHGNTRDAVAAHRESGAYQEKKLDFNWMFKNQYITKADP